jgi:hypothetical protein
MPGLPVYQRLSTPPGSGLCVAREPHLPRTRVEFMSVRARFRAQVSFVSFLRLDPPAVNPKKDDRAKKGEITGRLGKTQHADAQRHNPREVFSFLPLGPERVRAGGPRGRQPRAPGGCPRALCNHWKLPRIFGENGLFYKAPRQLFQQVLKRRGPDVH